MREGSHATDNLLSYLCCLFPGLKWQAASFQPAPRGEGGKEREGGIVGRKTRTEHIFTCYFSRSSQRIGGRVSPSRTEQLPELNEHILNGGEAPLLARPAAHWGRCSLSPLSHYLPKFLTAIRVHQHSQPVGLAPTHFINSKPNDTFTKKNI